MSPTLYLDAYRREFCLRLITIYIDAVKGRIVPSFENYHERAEQARDEKEQSLMESAIESTNGEAIHEQAFAYAFEKYEDGKFLKYQMISISSVGLYHLWERLIKSFIAEEAQKDQIKYNKEIDYWTMDNIVSCLAAFGYEMKKQGSWQYLNRLRLVANAVKHGSGSSKSTLFSEWPEIFRRHSSENPFIFFSENELLLEEHHFDQMARSACLFWQEMPQRMTVVPNDLGQSTNTNRV